MLESRPGDIQEGPGFYEALDGKGKQYLECMGSVMMNTQVANLLPKTPSATGHGLVTCPGQARMWAS